MPAGVVAIDRNWTVVYANRAAGQMARRPSSGLLGKSLFEVFPDVRDSAIERNYRRVLEEGVTVEFEAYYAPLDLWVHVRASPTDEGLVAYASDVTEQKRLLAAREEILAVVSHDLRNPLTTILGGLDVLARTESISETALERLARVRRAAVRMRRLIGDLLDFSRIERGALTIVPRPTSVPDAVAEAAEAVRPRARERRQRLALDVSPETPAAMADRERLLQVLGNLLDNAVKHTPTGGAIAVTVTSAPRGDVRVTVADSGPGVGESTPERLFEPFWQSTPGRDGGAGLGLFIARAIVEAHGGSIWVDTRPDAGAAFAFTVPAAA